jgi:hypothetical protein
MKKILGFVLALALVGCAAPRRVQGQFIGFVSLQTTQQTLATNAVCTGGIQQFPVSNLGQTHHYLSITTNSSVVQLSAEIDGTDKQSNIYRISDVLILGGTTLTRTGTLEGRGYFPVIFIQVTCSPGTGTFTLSYSGDGTTSNGTPGSYLTSQIDKIAFSGAPGNASLNGNFQTPFGTSGGEVRFQYLGSSAAGGTLQILCTTANGSLVGQTIPLTAALANNVALQSFQVADFACPFIQVAYANSGSAGTVVAEYIFSVPGKTLIPAYQFTHVTGTTATVAKAYSGFLHALTVNTSAAGTISIFDLAAASCTGTPSTNTVAVITAIAASPPENLLYDVNLLNGLCVKASVAMDFTVSSQ